MKKKCKIPKGIETGLFDNVVKYKKYIINLGEKEVIVQEQNNNIFQCYCCDDEEIVFDFFL